ncbi:MAG: hypothetical protein DWQ40_07085 [Actinobacteria bacterium]|nr:MAG: hypothetical protein DWQ40_07085 [Actinomycetota bacterium]
MTDRNNVQAAATGCLSRVFTLIGLFWFGVIGFDLFSSLQSGGRLEDFDFIGGFIPALAFLYAARIMRRRAREAAQDDSFVAPTTPEGTHRATTMTTPSSERGPTPSPIDMPSPPEDRQSGQRRERDRSRPVPELPPIEPVPDAGELGAIEALDISDFEPDRQLSSEEMVRRAKEKFLPKKPKQPPTGQ